MFFFAAGLLAQDKIGAERVHEHRAGLKITSSLTSGMHRKGLSPQALDMFGHDVGGTIITDIPKPQFVRASSKTSGDICTGTYPVGTTTLTPETP